MSSSDLELGTSVPAAINYARRDVSSDFTFVSMSGDMTKREKGSEHGSRKTLEAHEMHIYDARPCLSKLDLDRHGFFLTSMRSKITPTLEVLLAEDEKDIQEIYWPEVERLVRDQVRIAGRAPKYVFAIGTQKFTEDKSRGFLGSYSRQAHADFSDVVFDGAYKMLVKRGVPESEARGMDIMLINSWQPFGTVVHDNHLTILDWTSINPDADVVEKKRGTPIIKGHIYTSSIHHNPGHRWVYIPKMQPDEMWLFKQADSRSLPGLSKYAFHTAFKDPTTEPEAPPRRSISVRLICGFEKLPSSAL